MQASFASEVEYFFIIFLNTSQTHTNLGRFFEQTLHTPQKARCCSACHPITIFQNWTPPLPDSKVRWKEPEAMEVALKEWAKTKKREEASFLPADHFMPPLKIIELKKGLLQYREAQDLPILMRFQKEVFEIMKED